MHEFYGIGFCLVSYEEKTGKSDKVSTFLHLNSRHGILFVLDIDYAKLLELKSLTKLFLILHA